jgi:hypothetical protein
MAIHISSGGCGVLFVLLFFAAGLVAWVFNDPKWLLITPCAMIALALAIAALPIKRKVTPQQWASELEPHLVGTDRRWDWDDATSVRLADPRLEAVRVKLGKFDLMTEERRKELENLIAALKRGEIPKISD